MSFIGPQIPAQVPVALNLRMPDGSLLFDASGRIRVPDLQFLDGIVICDGTSTANYLTIEPYLMQAHSGPQGGSNDLVRMSMLIGSNYSLSFIPGGTSVTPLIHYTQDGSVTLGQSNSGQIFFCGLGGASIDNGGNLNLPASGGIQLNGGSINMNDGSGSGGQPIEMDGAGMNNAGTIHAGTNSITCGKFGENGNAAVAKQTIPAAATDLASAIALVNALRAALNVIGSTQ